MGNYNIKSQTARTVIGIGAIIMLILNMHIPNLEHSLDIEAVYDPCWALILLGSIVYALLAAWLFCDSIYEFTLRKPLLFTAIIVAAAFAIYYIPSAKYFLSGVNAFSTMYVCLILIFTFALKTIPNVLEFDLDYEPNDSPKREDLSEYNKILDTLLEESAQLFILREDCAASMLQRHFGIGYGRAGRIMAQLEQAGIISEADENGHRKMLITSILKIHEIIQTLKSMELERQS